MPDFDYRKLTLTEELDGTGKIKERREKVYEVAYRDGLSHSTLLQVNGHAPTDEDRKQQSQNETSLSQLLGQAKSAKGDNRENFLTSSLAARFDFEIVGQTNFNGRSTYQNASIWKRRGDRERNAAGCDGGGGIECEIVTERACPVRRGNRWL